MVKQVLPPHSSGKASAGPASAAKVRSASATASPIAARVKRMAAQSSTSGKRMPTAATNAAARAATARATSTTKKSRPTAGTKSQPVVPVQRKSSRKLHHEEAIAAVDDDLSADISSEERDDGDDGSDADSVDADHLDSADDRHASLDSDFEARSKHMPVVANSDSDSDVDDIYAPHRVAADSKGKGKAVVTPASAKAKGKPVTPASQKLKSKVASPASGKMTSKVATPMSGKMTSKVASPASQKTTSKAATPASATQNRTIKVKSVITDPDSDDTDSESDDVSPHTRRRMRVTARQEKVPSVDHSTALRQVAAAAAAFKPAVGLVSVEMPPRSTRSPHKATASDVRRAMATTRDDVSPRSKSVRADASAIAAAVSQSHASQSHGDSSAEPAPAGPSRVRRPPVITEHAFAHYMVPRKLKLFVGVDGDPMLFVLAKVSAVESIRKTIQQHGGRVVTVSDPSLTEEDMGRLIPLADKPHGIDPALREDFGDTFFSTRFVMDCIAADCVLDLDDYIFEADGVMPALDVAGRDVNESPSATSSRPASVATAAGAGAANAAASSSLIDNALDFINRNQLATMDFALFEKGGRRPG